ncbi:Ribosome biogenesis regulatory protein-like protein [Psilocybe cubensis]|uniref:Ribosome biogenesis regulatory protein n=2 Tax=Psilocybe cubensis TaxID=181762 RepID=A0A8H8CJS5_PSICU|nr:Ribosome biogenesis regulatory protein-like protein [Psilocybe cubensis]KAH9482496.1 Ribosome biogenesis regulatory protein-like protein [Psilocybe cubensis]
MDVSNILASHASKFKSVTVEKETPLEIDTGLLLVSDPNPIEQDSYKENLEEHLQSLARDGAQALISALFSLPTKQSPDGPLAVLPPPVFQLPRAKPLPKPKPQTKWEKFAAAKGIQHKVRDKKVWDEEKQEWVNRWGRNGKNREVEEQWIHEVPLNADVDYDPRKAARDERKQRIAKNEKKHQQNLARAGAVSRDERKAEIEKTLATTRISTASMGKFDKRLEGEKKIRGVKRKFDPNEGSVEAEKNASLNLLSKMESDKRKMRKEPQADEGVLNVRKAVKIASKGRGGIALGREMSGGKSRGRGGKGGRGGRR